MSDYAPSSAPNAIAPGWYADPLTPGQARWWSGQDWTHHLHELPREVDPEPGAPDASSDPVASSARIAPTMAILLGGLGLLVLAAVIVWAVTAHVG